MRGTHQLENKIQRLTVALASAAVFSVSNTLSNSSKETFTSFRCSSVIQTAQDLRLFTEGVPGVVTVHGLRGTASGKKKATSGKSHKAAVKTLKTTGGVKLKKQTNAGSNAVLEAIESHLQKSPHPEEDSEPKLGKNKHSSVTNNNISGSEKEDLGKHLFEKIQETPSIPTFFFKGDKSKKAKFEIKEKKEPVNDNGSDNGLDENVISEWSGCDWWNTWTYNVHPKVTRQRKLTLKGGAKDSQSTVI
jgi:hypothetical protein